MEINQNIVKAVKFLSCDKETITSVASYRNVLYVACTGTNCSHIIYQTVGT